MQFQFFDALGDGLAGAGQEAGAHAVRNLPQPEVEARRLHLIEIERPPGGDRPLDGQLFDQPG